MDPLNLLLSLSLSLLLLLTATPLHYRERLGQCSKQGGSDSRELPQGPVTDHMRGREDGKVDTTARLEYR